MKELLTVPTPLSQARLEPVSFALQASALFQGSPKFFGRGPDW